MDKVKEEAVIVTLPDCLHQTSGIQFEKHEQEGIDPMLFAEMMLMSGLVLMPQVILRTIESPL